METMFAPGPPLLNSVEVSCARLCLKKTKLFELLQTKQIASVKVGSKRLIPEHELQRYALSLEADE